MYIYMYIFSYMIHIYTHSQIHTSKTNITSWVQIPGERRNLWSSDMVSADVFAPWVASGVGSLDRWSSLHHFICSMYIHVLCIYLQDWALVALGVVFGLVLQISSVLLGVWFDRQVILIQISRSSCKRSRWSHSHIGSEPAACVLVEVLWQCWTWVVAFGSFVSSWHREDKSWFWLNGLVQGKTSTGNHRFSY